MDGTITIGIEASTKKFDKQIEELNSKIEKEEQKKIVIETKITSQEGSLDEQRRKVEQLSEAYQKFKKIQAEVETGKATPETIATFQSLQNTYGSLEKLGFTFDRAYEKQAMLEQKVLQTKFQYDAINSKVAKYKSKIESIKLNKQKNELDKIKQGFSGIGSAIEGTVKKAGKLVLGIFAIRSAYMLLRRASSELASYDEQYATNLEYIRFVLTEAIAPVLRAIVNLVAKILGYINAILQGWFGINLFANGSVENFNKMKAGANGVSKAVKEIKKQLTGFDEINMLTEQSDTGTSAGLGGVTPQFDLSGMQGKPPEWLQWIIDHKDLILAILAGIAAGILAIKLGLGGIKALGIGLLIVGIIRLIQNLQKYLEDPSWDNFANIITDIGIALLGLGIITGNVKLMIIGAIVAIVGLIAKNWDEIKQGFQRAIDWLKGIGDRAWQWFMDNIDAIQEKFGWLGVGIVSTLLAAFNWIIEIVTGVIDIIRNVFEGLFTGVKQIIDGIIQIVRGDFKEGLITILKGLANILIGILNGLISGINAILYPIRAIIAGIGSLIGKSWSVDTVKIPTIPYLKTGGIVNMPNTGTLVGSAMAGESGREGVIPLTDQQAMTELGREIGKNVLVNLTNITTMNGRVISRELKQVQNNQEFAYNQ